MIEGYISKLQGNARKNKVELFMKLCRPKSVDVILDVGITGVEPHPYDNMLEKMYAQSLNIIGLGIDDLTLVESEYGISCIRYDGGVFPFDDNSVDIIYSNAVIEHVGDFEKQCFFISEMLRVAKKSFFLTTPNRWCPIELHTKLPFIHYLPKDYADRLYKFFGKGWATGDYMYLLSESKLNQILHMASSRFDFKYVISPNKLLGFTITYNVWIDMS